MTAAVEFKQAKARRMLNVPCWWYSTVEAKTGEGFPVSGKDVAAARSFSKTSDSPRFPSATFARVQGGKG